MTNDLVLVGLGGTGSHLVEPLHRLMSFHPKAPKSLILIDGDHFEEKNAARQLFTISCIGKNKARVAADRLPQTDVQVRVEEQYLRRSNADLIENWKDPIVILAVDNDATRRLVLDELSYKPTWTVINPGNSLESGQVSVEAHRNGKSLTSSLVDRYQNIRQPSDQIPGGCAKETPSTPQLITANAFASTLTLCLLQHLFDGTLAVEEVAFDARGLKAKSNGMLSSALCTKPLGQTAVA